MGSFPQVDPRCCEVLTSRQVPHKEWHEHQKWVRYYIHFCNKYRHVPDDPESISLFIGKPASKNQTSAQQDQARRAIEFYFVLLSPKPPCPQRAVSDVPAASEVKGNFRVVKKQDGVSHYYQVSKGETDYCLPENRKKLACSHMHADSGNVNQFQPVLTGFQFRSYLGTRNALLDANTLSSGTLRAR